MLTGLMRLNLSETRITDQSLKELSTMTSLTDLDVRQRIVADREVVWKLERTGPGITGTGLKSLRSLKHLTRLNMGGHWITDVGLTELPQLPNLTDLSLQVEVVTEAGLKSLGHLQNLTRLSLQSGDMTDATLQEIAGLRNLMSLNLEEARSRRRDSGNSSDSRASRSLIFAALGE